MREGLRVSQLTWRIGKTRKDGDLKTAIDDRVFYEGGGSRSREAEAERSNDRREPPTRGFRRCRFGAWKFP